ETAPHPNADRLTICQITLGEGEPLQIVTGATNIKVGDIVPVAVNGAKLANDVTIKNSKLRGVPSNGMLCSGGELGLDPATMTPEQAEGIMLLAPDTPLGQDIKTIIGLDGAILDLELTPNRGDAMSMLGVAREVSALLGVPVKWPSTDLGKLTEDLAGRVKVEITDPELCFRYIGKLFTDIKVEPSPEWMQKRLQAAGVRPINNIVDITNYVLMEMGQPLHAFDYDQVKDGQIIVRRAREGEKMTTLDGIERQLNPEMLLIADPEKPLVVAGIMGGLESEVTEKTQRVLLESAVFEPVCVRKTSKRLGLRSESSSRFERGVDITNSLNAANRAARLLLELGAGKPVKGECDNYPRPFKAVEIKFRPQRAEYLLGLKVDKERCRRILSDLAFDVRETDELWVKVPAHRPDVRVEADLIEEIARMIGYDQIKPTLPYGAGTPGQRTPEQQAEGLLKDHLAALGVREVVTYSFISPDSLDKINLSPEDPARQMIVLQNPLSEEHSVMRTVTLPGILQVLQRNSSRQINNLAVFELGKVYLPQDGQVQEKTMLTVAAMGKTVQGWNKAAVKYDFYYLKGVLEVLLQALHIDKFQMQAVSDQPSWHP
ncbi:MAG: phenylalanine--tRNA ligase subunit beta, partial [Clostridia bacterium]|nr:phenylalanine--tRNA ligase subunit beta [Clostridia bacterium]